MNYMLIIINIQMIEWPNEEVDEEIQQATNQKLYFISASHRIVSRSVAAFLCRTKISHLSC